MKKIVSVILAVTLVFVLAAPGLAATDADARAALAALEAYLESNEGKTGTLSLDGKTTLYHAFYVDFDQNGIPELVRVFSTTDVHFPSYADVKYVTKENGNWVVHQTERGFGNGGRGGYSQTSDFGRFSDGNYGFRINIDYTWYDMPSEVYHYKFKGNEFVEAEEGGFQILDEPQDRFALYSLPSVTAAPAVQRSAQSLSVNGQTIDCDKYNIDGSNYFKLRDIAYLLNGTASQFSVLWDSVNQHVIIITGRAYEADKTELVVGADKSAEAQPSVQTIQIDGVVHSDLSAYNIGGNNYFKLRDLGEKLGFTVDYDEATNTAIVKSTEQFIGEHTAASSVTDGEYTVKFAGTHQSVQGGELVDVELIENVCFTDGRFRNSFPQAHSRSESIILMQSRTNCPSRSPISAEASSI